jgi:two-component system sensor histidine kinase UhpB
MTLFRRLFLVNATIFVLGTLALAISPATVSFPVQLTEALVLVVGLSVMLALNLVFVRLSLAPLDRLMSLMRRVDLLRPGQRLDLSGPGEVQELGRVFNEMLDRLERERRESLRRALAAQEGERARVARELHDETGQTLGAIVLQLGNLAARVPEPLRDDVQLAQETARGTLEDVRRIARQLRPEALDDLGLVSALTALTRRFAEQTGLALERQLGPLPELDPDVELVVYRVAQEGLANVARHAQASRVWLSLESVDGSVRLRVADDGVGIRQSAHDGHGISGMRERALLVGGDLVVAERAGGGVEVCLEVPVA